MSPYDPAWARRIWSGDKPHREPPLESLTPREDGFLRGLHFALWITVVAAVFVVLPLVAAVWWARL